MPLELPAGWIRSVHQCETASSMHHFYVVACYDARERCVCIPEYKARIHGQPRT